MFAGDHYQFVSVSHEWRDYLWLSMILTKETTNGNKKTMEDFLEEFPKEISARTGEFEANMFERFDIAQLQGADQASIKKYVKELFEAANVDMGKQELKELFERQFGFK